MSTLKELRELFDMEYTYDERIRVAKQHLGKGIVWRFVWRDDSEDWAYASMWYRTKGQLLATLPQFIVTTYGE